MTSKVAETPSNLQNGDVCLDGADATWTSAFQAACWINPLYYSTTIDDSESIKILKDDYSKNLPTKSSQELKEESEVFGWTLDAAARGVAVMGTAVFVSTELLRLAKEAAGCIVGEAEIEVECDNRVYGMRPSSILTNIVIVVGFFSAFMMPLIGSIIDYTPHRRAVGSVSAAVLSICILIQMILMERFWFVAAILQVFIAFSYTVHLCAVYAYLPELTSNHEKMVHYTAQFSATQYTGSVCYLVLIVGILSAFHRNERFKAVILSQSVVFIVCVLCFGYAWTKLFRSRPAGRTVPVGRNLLSAGFCKLYKTGQTILESHTAIKWLLVSVAFTEAATTTFSTVAITYMTHYLGFSSRQNGIAILILLLFGIPGTRLAAWLTRRYNPIRSLQVCLLLWIINTTAATILLKEPGQENLAYFFAMFWGLAMGWVYPSEKTLYITITPRGQEGELMGVYICACQILSWLPPLVFTIMNEMGISIRFAFFALTFYFMISFFVLFLVGDYDEAVLYAKEIDERRLQCSTAPQSGLGIDNYGCYQEWLEGDDGLPLPEGYDGCGINEWVEVDKLVEGYTVMERTKVDDIRQ